MTTTAPDLTPDEALALLPDSATVHAIRQPVQGICLAAHWTRRMAETAIRKAARRERSGPVATRYGHGLMIEGENGWTWFETRTNP